MLYALLPEAMAGRGYSWKNVRQGSTFSLPKTEHVGRLVLVAIILAVIAHIIAIIGLKKMQITFPVLRTFLEIETEPIVVRDIVFNESLPEIPLDELPQPPEVAGNLLDEIEMLESIPEDTELDMSPDIKEMQFDIEMLAPAAKGDVTAETLEPIAGLDLSNDLPTIGKVEEVFQVAAAGQIIIDPGKQMADEFDSDKFNQELARKGADGLVDGASLNDYTALSVMTNMSGNALQNSKGMIGSDLLFEFNQAVLKESARNSLLKVALLIDKNPNLVCWIEGHTDTIGRDIPNGELSLSRARAVKQWLVKSMLIDPKRLIVIGHGKRQPIIKSGDKNQQAMNRRVVIKMRKGRPSEDANVFLERSIKRQPAPAKAILVRPTGPPIIPVAKRVGESPPRRIEKPTPIGKAQVIENQPLKAVPVVPGKAIPTQ